MNIADHPDELFVVTDDQTAKTLLKKLGILERLQKAIPNPCPLPNQSARIIIWDHPTHWIVAEVCYGFERADENGFVLICDPKSKTTRTAFEKQVEADIKTDFTQGHTRTNDELPPTGNN